MNDALPTATLEALQQRAKLLAHTRGFFEKHGYWEVETPLLSHDSCIDQWIEPFQVQVGDETAYLQTSPEFAMKRLLCAGAQAIYQITRSFRQDEVGQNHNPEFSILEWYRVGDDHFAQMDFVEALINELSALSISSVVNPLPAPFLRMTYGAAFERFLGRSLITCDNQELLEIAKEQQCFIPVDSDRDQILNCLLAEIIEPKLKELGAVFIYDYPSSQAALAKVREKEFVAERFELYLNGIEICNGYHEVTDASEVGIRMLIEFQKRYKRNLPTLQLANRLTSAMKHGMPDCAGVALGFDRLVMHCLGKEHIQDVIPFPFSRA